MLDQYKKLKSDWGAEGCLLCSEDKPHHCHRRLVAEYLKESLKSRRGAATASPARPVEP